MTFAPVLLAALGVSAFWWLSQRPDRRRLQAAVRERGGEVLKLKLKGWGRAERSYEVLFRSREGQLVTARCAVSLLTGVRWTEELLRFDIPESTFGDQAGTDIEALVDPAACLACGAAIPAWKSRCPQCGWSYKD